MRIQKKFFYVYKIKKSKYFSTMQTHVINAINVEHAFIRSWFCTKTFITCVRIVLKYLLFFIFF
ncbi:unknown [Neodiprion lecontei nucleopolyhedrovirus]|uniref:Uncharacterized protein n=1 Tax=Neodiprion lecontei nucleopolyhedrovirus (strain Canada) TaxID=654906 RepID=Q6JPF2_NPVNC|nr:unknown [Neodiprion lecontei nucleopolyhedrovirus]AAQ99134.1 unknown [Neodiprion lecontei nucleopolyhedrovirus]